MFKINYLFCSLKKEQKNKQRIIDDSIIHMILKENNEHYTSRVFDMNQ